MGYTNFPRNRDEFLEPPDDDGSQDAFNDYFGDNYEFVTMLGDEMVYYDDGTFIWQPEEFSDDGEGGWDYEHKELDEEELNDLAIALFEQLQTKENVK